MARGSTTTRSESDAAESLIGRGARIRGRVHGDGSLRVEGSVEGNIQLAGDLEIEDGATVTGDVEASSLVVSGQLTGDVASRGPVTIRATAQYAGNVGGSEVILEEGAAFAGRIEAEFDLPAELSERRTGGRGQAPRREPAGR
ncbi:polymer-forming cytoskeletal protein [Sorangium sp. So ce302]|uniref:bactofilin family protein n=1 Tax=Sorangium sp. So ce302 TaxID=3133297 RepID=UPI003F5FD1FD